MSTPSLDLRQPRQFLFCKVEFYLQRHYTSRAHLLRLAKLYHAKLLDSILRMEYIFMSGVVIIPNKERLMRRKSEPKANYDTVPNDRHFRFELANGYSSKNHVTV